MKSSKVEIPFSWFFPLQKAINKLQKDLRGLGKGEDSEHKRKDVYKRFIKKLTELEELVKDEWEIKIVPDYFQRNMLRELHEAYQQVPKNKNKSLLQKINVATCLKSIKKQLNKEDKESYILLKRSYYMQSDLGN